MHDLKVSSKFIEDTLKLKRESPKLAAKVWELINDILINPYSGIGKPEPLKGDMQGWWSRRVDEKHRLIYKYEEDILELASCYGHYDDK